MADEVHRVVGADCIAWPMASITSLTLRRASFRSIAFILEIAISMGLGSGEERTVAGLSPWWPLSAIWRGDLCADCPDDDLALL